MLGSLYDATRNRLAAPGMTFWTDDQLKKNLVYYEVPYTDAKINGFDFYINKRDLLDISASIQVDIYDGLISVQGGGMYKSFHRL